MRKKIKGLSILTLSSMLFFGVGFSNNNMDIIKAQTKELNVSVPTKQVKVGKQISLKVKEEDVTFSSSDREVANVSTTGVITGKKAGTTTIKVKCSGYKTYSCKITVKKNGRKPSLPVALDEVKLTSAKLEEDKSGNMTYSAVVKNTAKKGTVKKVEYYYEANVAVKDNTVSTGSAITSGAAITTKKTTVHITAKNIKAGKTSARVSCKGDASGELSNMKLKKVKLYTGSALYVWNAQTGNSSFDWGVPDKTKPTFSGWIKKNSYSPGKEMYCVYYSDKKNSYDFAKYVKAVDDRDGKVKISVDTSKINWKKNGVYKVIFNANDKAGNKAKTWAKVQVYVAGTAEAVADEVLNSIIKKGWSDEKKARVIHDYVIKHCYYVGTSNHDDWRSAGLRGLRYQSGDCYTYYAVCRLLLTRANIPNIMIKRYPVYNARHFWNLTYVAGGWYHLDTTPRLRKGKFCLVTDAQLHGYSSGNTFSFNSKLYPKRATKKISSNP